MTVIGSEEINQERRASCALFLFWNFPLPLTPPPAAFPPSLFSTHSLPQHREKLDPFYPNLCFSIAHHATIRAISFLFLLNILNCGVVKIF